MITKCTRIPMFSDFHQNILFIGKSKNENSARDRDGKCPDAKYGEKGFAFTTFSTTKWTRDVKKTIDRENGQMPDRCSAEKNIEKHEEITKYNW